MNITSNFGVELSPPITNHPKQKDEGENTKSNQWGRKSRERIDQKENCGYKGLFPSAGEVHRASGENTKAATCQ